MTGVNARRLAKLVAKMRENSANVDYGELHMVCFEYFGKPRQQSGSHSVFKTSWPGDPRVNIQPGRDGKANPYQVKQVLAAIDKLQGLKGGEDK